MPTQLMEQLYDQMVLLHNVETEKMALVDSVLTHEVKAKLQEIDAEFADKVAAQRAKVDALTEQVKKSVIAHGSSIKSAHLHAVYNKARKKWNSDMLEGLALAFPEISKACETGDPSVSIKQIASK